MKTDKTMKREYMTPRMEVMDMAANGSICLISVSGGDTGLGNGGNASDGDGIWEAELNENTNWDLW